MRSVNVVAIGPISGSTRPLFTVKDSRRVWVVRDFSLGMAFREREAGSPDSIRELWFWKHAEAFCSEVSGHAPHPVKQDNAEMGDLVQIIDP
jgi:hypothetical protein